MSDADRRTIAGYLKREAVTLSTDDAPQRRGRPAGTERAYKIATDYLATWERLGKSTAAVSEVMAAWKIGRTAVTDAHKSFRDAARSELKRVSRANPQIEREKLLDMISKALRKKSPDK